MMWRGYATGALALLGVMGWTAAFAQVPTDAAGQRACAALCLSTSPGPTSPEYPYCLQVKCGVYYEDPAANSAAPTRARAGWGAGVTADGTVHYAGLSDESLTQSIYYICDKAGASSISLSGGDVQPGILAVSIDLERYQLDFQAKDGALYAYAPMDSAVMVALMRGSRLELYNEARELLAGFSLRGASRAIQEARQGCQ
jgi:hypothetical protein